MPRPPRVPPATGRKLTLFATAAVLLGSLLADLAAALLDPRVATGWLRRR